MSITNWDGLPPSVYQEIWALEQCVNQLGALVTSNRPRSCSSRNATNSLSVASGLDNTRRRLFLGPWVRNLSDADSLQPALVDNNPHCPVLVMFITIEGTSASWEIPDAVSALTWQILVTLLAFPMPVLKIGLAVLHPLEDI